MKSCVAAIVMFVVLALPRSAAAQCTISTTGVNFGSYEVFTPAPRDATGSVTYRCLLPLGVQITLTRGSSATFDPRRLQQGSETLQYNLYRDSGHSVIWGDGSGGTSFYSGTVSIFQINQDIVVAVYGRIPQQQDVTAGSYADTITATINF